MQKTVNSNATESAKELLNYLSDTAGNAIITGQHTQTVPMEEIDYIKEVTGKEPLLRGFELLAYSPNINYDDAGEECLTEVYENRNTVESAIDWANETNGIVTLTFHWFSPIGGRDKSFYTVNTDFDPERILIDNTPERKAFYHDMDVIADELQKFLKNDIPVLWRPFHEAYGDWFWWGSKGPVVASKLYQMMYEYYTDELHLDNLLWVWNCPIKEAYPGDEYVDVISVDIYLEEYEKTDYKKQYEEMIEATSKEKVAALAEIGYLPDIKALEKSRVPWAYYMLWSKEFVIGEEYNSREDLCAMYESEYSITM
jgi:mannan endo-1,4-beta-mannosidase